MNALRDFLDDELRHFIAGRSEFSPFPRHSERLGWEQLSPSVTDPIIADAVREAPWPLLPATLYMDYSRTGNRERYQEPYFQRRENVGRLVVAECIEAKGRFLDSIIDGIWMMLEETSWVIPAHNNQRPGSDPSQLILPDAHNRYIDLFAAATGALLAWSLYLLGDPLREASPMIPSRIEAELNNRIISPYLAHDDFWWMGFNEEDVHRVNNWNPWCNSNCLAVSLLTDDDDDRRFAVVEKACRSLDVFLESYGFDGGCDEGPSYWGHAGASLFDCLELLFLATGGRIDLYGDERVRNIGRYIYRSHLSGPFYVNFADCTPRVSPPSDLVYRYGKRIDDEPMQQFGAWLFAEAGGVSGIAAMDAGRDLFRYLHAVFNADELRRAPAAPALPLSAWFPDIEVAVVREAQGSAEGFALAVKGGHNAESHNHNDVGQVIVLYDGEPVLIDPGVQTYTAKTFSDKRYEIWTMQSAYHNLPTIGGAMQRPGRSAAARESEFSEDGSAATFATEISGAYPETSGVAAFRRTVVLDRDGRKVTVSDSFACAGETAIEWSFLLPREPGELPAEIASGLGRSSGDQVGFVSTKVRLSSAVTLTASGAAFEPRIERIPIDDSRLKPQWGEALSRLVLATRSASGAVTFALTAV